MFLTRILAGAVAVFSIACTAPAPSDPNLGSTSSRIIGGRTDAGHPAIVVFEATGDDGGDCTAEFVTTNVLLTAAHCLQTEDGKPLTNSTFRIFRGNDFSKATDDEWITIDPKNVHAHPSFKGEEHDIAVLVLDKPVDVKPLAISRTPLASADVGKPVTIAGYGASIAGAPEDSDGFGLKRELDTTVTKIETHFLQVGKKGQTACDGDSGGPALVTIGGVETIVGVDSFSDADKDCTEGEFYQRVDTELAFITPFLTMTTAEAHEEAPENTTSESDQDEPDSDDPPAKKKTTSKPSASASGSAGCSMRGGARGAAWPALLALLLVARRRRKDLSAKG